MKATYKRCLAAAFATVGLMSLATGQVNMDPIGPGSLGPDQTPVTQGTTDSPTTTTPVDLGLKANGASQLDTTNSPKIMINQIEVTFAGAQPGLINGQLMVPIRDVVEQLGASVKWQDLDKQAVITLPSQQDVTVTTNQDWLDMLNVNDQTRPLRFHNADPEAHLMLNDNEVVLIDNRAYMPFDQLCAAINCTGNWDVSIGTATITTSGEDNQVPNGSDNPPDKTPSPDID